MTALRRRETLTSQLTKTLTERIVKGALKPGDKLPSEQELIEQYSVSRTVVREAISSLRAAGLVATQQGVGAFVQPAAANQPFRIDENSLDLIKEVINVLELRIGLEAEAAALAAQRRKPEHLEAMRVALDRMAAAIEASEDAIAPDLEFHQTIAEATGNMHFTHLFGYLGALMIPRARVQTFRFFADDRTAYLNRVNGEHEDIYQAIARQDSDAARSAMRLHLSNSRERLRKAMEPPLSA
ncbi:FadR/GntR family transcriptional regulator [Ferrovibrio sp.]|uniref:FadR/GntR family transcriptional regulator n=1 Tax=Ferrovibrio sp. TaxID=1917215 RepID=UPI000CBB54D9|nr:FadR/GntR family transcriptional regulator [Ferrovibrio sp.]PJI39105.1 MAG: GntR family transcriptional regulator [Ferrovibrio sp.]